MNSVMVLRKTESSAGRNDRTRRETCMKETDGSHNQDCSLTEVPASEALWEDVLGCLAKDLAYSQVQSFSHRQTSLGYQ